MSALGVVVQRGDQLAEAGVVLGQPGALGVQRLGQPRQLLVGREVAVAHDGGRRDREVDRPEQRVVELGLGLGEVRPAASRSGRSRARPRAQLVEHARARRSPTSTRGGGTRRARSCRRRRPCSASTRLRAGSESRSRSSTPACSPRAISRLSAAVIAASSRARRSAAAPSKASPSRSASSGVMPVAAARSAAQRDCGEPPEHDLRVLELAQRLVGQTGDRQRGLGAGDPRDVRGAPNWPHRARPLLLDAPVGREHERALADAADQLDAEQRLARPGRGDDVRGAAARLRGRARTRPARPAGSGATAPKNCRSSKRLTRRAARGRARAPSPVRWSNGKPIRWRPSASTSTVWAECSRPCVCGRSPNAFHTGSSCARVPSRKSIRPVIACLSRNDLRELRRVVGRVDRTPITRHVVPEVVERAADRLHLRRAGVAAGRVDERVRRPAARAATRR